MNILHIVPTISNLSAGTTDTVLKICEEQHLLGHKIELLTLSSKNFSYEENHSSGFKIRYFKRNFFPHPKLGRSKEMLLFLKSNISNYQVIHTHMLWMSPCYYAALACNSNEILHVCSPHGSLNSYGLNRSYIKKSIVRYFGQNKSLNRTNILHATSYDEAKELEILYPSKIIKQIRLGISICSKDLILNKKIEKKILFLSRIHPKKRLEFLITNFIAASKEITGWKLCIAGPSEDISYLNKIQKIVNNNNNISLLGPVYGNKKYKLMADSSLFVLPTKSENFGLVVGEALSCETPVICSDGAPWEMLNKNKCGWWVKDNDFYDALLHAMKLTYEELHSMGKTGRNVILKDYSWKETSEQLLKSYKENAKQ